MAKALRVLVVDSWEDGADCLALLLQTWGYEARVAHAGAAALEAARTFRPDVIIMDLALPALNGLEVARRVRGLPGHKRVTLVCLTGYCADRYRRLASEAGFDYFLPKGCEPEKIRELLVRIEGWQAGKEGPTDCWEPDGLGALRFPRRCSDASCAMAGEAGLVLMP